MTSSTQLLFDFPGSQSFTPENTLPLPEQESMWRALNDDPMPRFIIQAAAGLGKSHLLNLWATQHQAALTDLTQPESLNAPLLVDGVDTLNTAQHEMLFHAFNAAQAQGQPVIVTTSVPIQTLSLLPDLKTRLLTLPELKIEPFGEASLTQLLLKWAHDCQLKLDKSVVKYILTRAERSPQTLKQMIAQLNTLSLTEKRAVTVPLVGKILSQNTGG